MATLRECPFCGGKAKLKRGLPNLGTSKTVWALVQCLSCFCRTPTVHQEKGETAADVNRRAIELWNRRTTDGS